MRRLRLRAQVIIEFLIDIDGDFQYRVNIKNESGISTAVLS
jgi:hypothetical protein